MARKPKSAPSIEPELSVDEPQPSPDETPAPARRGRKKTSAAISGPAPADGVATAPALPMTDTPPAQGRKPPGRRKAAPPSLLDQALEQQPEPDMASSNPAAKPASAGDDTMIAEMAYPVSAGDASTAPPSEAAPPSLSQDTPPAKPAAQWNRATDTVQFDWPEIERTASQDGPNQVMAKLLVAARAEGATSRWPL
jgi:hypothetical protein